MRYFWTGFCWISLCLALLGFMIPLVMGYLLSAQTGDSFDLVLFKEVWMIGMFHAGALFTFIFGILYLLARAKSSNEIKLKTPYWVSILIGILAVTIFYAINANIDNYSALSLLILLGAAIIIRTNLKAASL